LSRTGCHFASTSAISAVKGGTKYGGERITHRIQSHLSRHIPTPRLQSDSYRAFDLFQVVNNAGD
jgi:hypothetical protein